MSELPVLYSFRRCPYAMRARMAIAASGVQVSLREVLLRDKPPELLAVSPKATVPVLVLSDGGVIEESLDVMVWALEQSDPCGWLKSAEIGSEWIHACDNEFKGWLDRYKYADRYPAHPASVYRQHAEAFLAKIEDKLSASLGLTGEAPSIVDVALFPFIRQFAGVDPVWWQEAPYPRTRVWLEGWLNSALFDTIMAKYPRWETGQTAQRFPSEAAAT
ncbi:MAG: glutathione S-transferase [Halieaceae bacterium]